MEFMLAFVLIGGPVTLFIGLLLSVFGPRSSAVNMSKAATIRQKHLDKMDELIAHADREIAKLDDPDWWKKP